MKTMEFIDREIEHRSIRNCIKGLINTNTGNIEPISNYFYYILSAYLINEF